MEISVRKGLTLCEIWSVYVGNKFRTLQSNHVLLKILGLFPPIHSRFNQVDNFSGYRVLCMKLAIHGFTLILVGKLLKKLCSHVKLSSLKKKKYIYHSHLKFSTI